MLMEDQVNNYWMPSCPGTRAAEMPPITGGRLAACSGSNRRTEEHWEHIFGSEAGAQSWLPSPQT